MQVTQTSPRSIERGPVEANRKPDIIGFLLLSPRSIERGPVEASCGRWMRGRRIRLSALD